MTNWRTLAVLVVLLLASVGFNVVLWKQVRLSQVSEQTAQEEARDARMDAQAARLAAQPIILPALPPSTTAPAGPVWVGPYGERDPNIVIAALVKRINELDQERNALWVEAHSTRPVSASLVTVNFSTARKSVWFGWSLSEGLPAAGGAYRLLGPVWGGGWIRPGTRWDGGPTLGVVW